MKLTRLIVALAVQLTFFMALSGYGETGDANPVEPTPESLEKGKAIYRKQCQMCHGESGRGDGPAGRRMKPEPFDLTDPSKIAEKSDDDFFRVITEGKPPMPPFKRKLDETDRWHVINFVRTLAANREPN